MASRNLDEAVKRGLRKAAGIVARRTREVASTRSSSIPPTVKSGVRGSSVGDDVHGIYGYVEAGGEGGREAPAAYMFESKGAKHPLYGDRKHWYRQGYWPFMERAADDVAEEIANAIASEIIDGFSKEVDRP